MHVRLRCFTRLAGAVALAVLLGQPLAGQGRLSPQDTEQITQLSAQYAATLAACDAEKFADLFAVDGAFVSGFRGRMQGREKLSELVTTERHCRSENRVPLDGPLAAPQLTVEATATGARATGVLGTAGQYEDTYVKTPNGWRFQVREFLTTKEIQSRQSK